MHERVQRAGQGGAQEERIDVAVCPEPFSKLSPVSTAARHLQLSGHRGVSTDILWNQAVREQQGEYVTDTTYVSRVKIEPVEGKIRRAQIPGEEEPVLFGVHSEVAEHYGVSPDQEEPHASTLDYLVAAAGG
jgi:hypothetical protein